MFGQPLEVHYAAAKAGLVGLANVIAVEGTQHDIRANTVLPFGFSRMVTETVGDPKALEETRFGRVFVGLGKGWLRAGQQPDAEEVANHLADVSVTEPFTVPGSIFE
jgi:NAD(P)-dependent dehydrogenase (short-subunit alcohol dehydrogenase family)